MHFNSLDRSLYNPMHRESICDSQVYLLSNITLRHLKDLISFCGALAREKLFAVLCSHLNKTICLEPRSCLNQKCFAKLFKP